MSRQRPLRFFGGKGGVGKSTMAAASALGSARAGWRTLLVSTDPAHSLGDVLGRPLGPDPTEVAPNLHAVEVDPEAAASAHLTEVTDRLSRSVSPELVPAVRRHLELARTAPGTLESALFDVMTELMEACPSDAAEPAAPGAYDRIVFDTAPTGHTLRLLALPALLAAWVEGLARQRESVAGMDRMVRNMAGQEQPDDDPLLAALHERRSRFERAARRLHDDASLWLVLVPERLPIEETARAAKALANGDLLVGGLVVNRLLPEHADGEFLAARRDQQHVYEAEIEARFPGYRIVRVGQQPRDIAGLDDLDVIAQSLPAELVS